jgi:hypothetical protein
MMIIHAGFMIAVRNLSPISVTAMIMNLIFTICANSNPRPTQPNVTTCGISDGR